MFGNDIVLTVVITTLFILLLICGIIITMILANRRHVQQEIKMAQMQVDYEREMRTMENEVQEQVLAGVARELHDNIGQLLTLIRIQLEQEKLDDNDLAERLAPIDNTLNDTIQQVRMLSHNLNTDYLESKGLIYAIEKEVERLGSLRSIKITFEHSGKELEMRRGKKVMIFRMVQELLANALKYSAAKHIKISLPGDGRTLVIVEDDGRGFDVSQVMNEKKGSGLQNVLKRSKLAEVTVDMSSTPGKGSIFTVSDTLL